MKGLFNRLWVIHLVTNALLIWLIYEWLGIPDAKGTQLFTTVILGLIILFFVLWLHGSTFAFFRERLPLRRAFARGLHGLPRFGLWVLAMVVIYWFLAWLDGYSAKPAFAVASWFTLHLRMPVTPVAIGMIFTVAIRVLQWAVVPLLLLPFAWPPSRRFEGWLWWQVPVLAIGAFFIPWKLVHWVPNAGGVTPEAISAALRFG
ncbi:MAG: hypothetical protein ACRD4P_02690, partial [Bryobacteraceae bacterium]